MERTLDRPDFVAARKVAEHIEGIYEVLDISVDTQVETELSIVDTILSAAPNQAQNLREKVRYFLASDRGTRYPARRT